MNDSDFIQVDGDVIEMSTETLIFRPIGGGQVLRLRLPRRKIKNLPPQPRLCRLTHDGGQVIKLEAFYLG